MTLRSPIVFLRLYMYKISITIKCCLAFVFCFFFFVFARGQSITDADAIIEKAIKEYRLNPDGSMEYHVYRQIRLLTYNAFHRLYGETFIVYHPQVQRLKINDCYTIMADGKKVMTPNNAFNEVLPRFAANAPVYNHLREMVVTHTGLEVGATIYLDYTVYSQKDYMPALMGYDALAEASPVKDLSYIVRVPSGNSLNFKLYNIVVKPSIREEADTKIYEWKFKDLPQVLSESFQPKEGTFMPFMVFSSAKDMESIYKVMVNQPALQFAINEQMKAELEKISKDNPDELMSILKLQEKVVNDVNLYPIPIQFLGFRVRTPVEVWKTNGGTEFEKAILLCTLLNGLNINAEPVAMVGESYDPGIGNLLNFSNFLVKVSLKKGDPIYLSVMSLDDQNLKYKLDGKTLLPLNPRKSLKILMEKGEDNRLNAKDEFTLDKDNRLEGNVNLQLTAALNPYFDLKKNEKKAQSFWRAGISNDFKEIRISDFEPSHSGISYTVKKEDACRKEGAYWFFEIPQSERGLASWHLSELPSVRNNPFELPFPLEENYEITIELPANMELISTQNTEIHNTAGDYRFSLTKTKDKLLIEKKITLTRSNPGKDYYQDFRKLVNQWYSRGNREVVLKTP